MRAELLNFVENQRMAQLPDGTYDMQPAQDFKYKALVNELHVGDVYLRVYNEQPDLEVADGRRLCEALVDFISGIMEERQKLPEDEVFSEVQVSTSTITKTEYEHGPPSVDSTPSDDQRDLQEEQGDGIKTQTEDGDLLVAIDDQAALRKAQRKTLVKNLTMALTALQVCLLLVIAEFLWTGTNVECNVYAEHM